MYLIIIMSIFNKSIKDFKKIDMRELLELATKAISKVDQNLEDWIALNRLITNLQSLIGKAQNEIIKKESKDIDATINEIGGSTAFTIIPNIRKWQGKSRDLSSKEITSEVLSKTILSDKRMKSIIIKGLFNDKDKKVAKLIKALSTLKFNEVLNNIGNRTGIESSILLKR